MSEEEGASEELLEIETSLSKAPSSDSPLNFLIDIFNTIYTNKYYRETAKSIIIFLIGIKLAKECYHIIIPLREYEPFQIGCSRCG